MKKSILLTSLITLFLCCMHEIYAQKTVFSGRLIQQEKSGIIEQSNEYPFILELKQKKNKISGTSFFITPNGEAFVKMHLTGTVTGNKMVLIEDKIIEGAKIDGTYYLKELRLTPDNGKISGSWKDLGTSGVVGSFEGRSVELLKTK